MHTPTIELVAPGNSSLASQISRQRTADLLRLSLGAVDKLEASGYMPDRDLQRVLKMANAPFARSVDIPVPVIRQGVATAVTGDPDRQVIGESASMSDAEVLLADRMWWRGNASNFTEAGILPITVSGFVVTVLRIDGHEDEQYVEVPATPSKGAYREVRHRFAARLAGRVGRLGEPATYRLIDDSVEPAFQDLTRRLLGNRSSARSGGPVAYLPTRDESR